MVPPLRRGDLFASRSPAPAPGGGRGRKTSWKPREKDGIQFLCPVPLPPPRRGRGQKLLEAKRRGWYPNFCVFFTAWLPNGYQKRRESVGAVETGKMENPVWLPNGYQGNFFGRKGSPFCFFRPFFQPFRPLQGALYWADWPKKSPKALKTGRKAPKPG